MKFSTLRCVIRKFSEDDIISFMEYRNNLEWMKFQNFKGLNEAEYRNILLKDKSIQDGIQLAIFTKENDELIGDIYLQQEKNFCWLGYTIKPEKSRQGYAYEVVSSLIFELKKYNIKTIKAGADTENMASINLLKKLGFIFEKMDLGDEIYKLIV